MKGGHGAEGRRKGEKMELKGRWEVVKGGGRERGRWMKWRQGREKKRKKIRERERELGERGKVNTRQKWSNTKKYST